MNGRLDIPHRGATRPRVSHQTVRLSRGKHASPYDGVCVMELASMLAGEDFTDHPESVCPVIGAFLRAYNDSIEDDWRQDLYAYAAKVVGTRSTLAVECWRADLCRAALRQGNEAGGDSHDAAGSLWLPDWLRRCVQRARREFSGRRAGLTLGRPEVDYGGFPKPDWERHRAALRLLEELIALGDGSVEPAGLRQLAAEEPAGADVGSPSLNPDDRRRMCPTACIR